MPDNDVRSALELPHNDGSHTVLQAVFQAIASEMKVKLNPTFKTGLNGEVETLFERCFKKREACKAFKEEV